MVDPKAGAVSPPLPALPSHDTLMTEVAWDIIQGLIKGERPVVIAHVIFSRISNWIDLRNKHQGRKG